VLRFTVPNNDQREGGAEPIKIPRLPHPNYKLAYQPNSPHHRIQVSSSFSFKIAMFCMKSANWSSKSLQAIQSRTSKAKQITIDDLYKGVNARR
jgi:hypothetical protein